MKEKLNRGDRVIEINGKAVGTFDFCESVTTGIPALQKKKKNVLTILTREGEKKVNYYYQKKKKK